jgi:hypothetical protein
MAEHEMLRLVLDFFFLPGTLYFCCLHPFAPHGQFRLDHRGESLRRFLQW